MTNLKFNCCETIKKWADERMPNFCPECGKKIVTEYRYKLLTKIQKENIFIVEEIKNDFLIKLNNIQSDLKLIKVDIGLFRVELKGITVGVFLQEDIQVSVFKTLSGHILPISNKILMNDISKQILLFLDNLPEGLAKDV